MGGFDYPNEFMHQQEMFADGMGAAFGVFIAIYLLVIFFSFAFSVVLYIFQSLGLYTIAERRGIRNPWLAWIPFGNVWILGSISDQYQYVAKGKIKNRRKLLLGLMIGLIVSYVGWFILMFTSLILSEGAASGSADVVLLAVLGMLVFMVLAILALVYEFVCLFDLYHSCNPNNGVLFLVLSILFTVTMPFFVFACRKKDLGMPPRKVPAQKPMEAEIVEAEVVAEPVQEGYASPEEFEDA